MLRTHPLAILVIVATSLPTTAIGASFYLLESSDSRLGNAFAGTASAGDDASTVFFNGAAMTRLDRTTVDVAGHAVFTDADFRDQGSSTASGAPLTGKNGSTTKKALVPNLYVVTHLPKVSDRIRVGLGINAPFGLKTSYDDDWVGRYHATDSSLRTVNVNPQIAYQVTEHLSLGIGANYQRLDTELENQVDSFATCLGAGGSRADCGNLGGFGNQNADSTSTIEGSDSGFGLDLSLLYSFSEDTRAGLSWRQGIDYDLTGDVDFDKSTACTANPVCAGALDRRDGADVNADLSLPDIVNLSLTHRFNPDWRMDADIAWYGWDALQQVRIETDRGQEISTLELEYEDTFRYALGLTYSGLANWDLRTGIGYDESPITGKDTITPRIPTGDRTHFALGATYHYSDRLTVDMGWLHVRVDSVDLANTEQGNTLRGQFKDPTANVLAGGVNWRF